MKFLVLFPLLFTAQALADNQEVGGIIFEDIESHIADYYNLAMRGQLSIPQALLSYYQAVKTYTDDSYTTLFSDFPVSEMMHAVTKLPWYSSRLESEISIALTQKVTLPGELSDSSSIFTSTGPSGPSLSSDSIPYIAPYINTNILCVPSYAYNKTRHSTESKSALSFETSSFSKRTSISPNTNVNNGLVLSLNLVFCFIGSLLSV